MDVQKYLNEQAQQATERAQGDIAAARDALDRAEEQLKLAAAGEPFLRYLGASALDRVDSSIRLAETALVTAAVTGR